MENNKISARRYGRLLAVLALKQQLITNNTEYDVDSLYKDVCHIASLKDVPLNVQKQIYNFHEELIKGVSSTFDTLTQIINSHSKNRTWDQFAPLDKALLLIGTYDLGHNSSIPKICIKEILIASDALQNEHAAPYLSGILKTIAYGNQQIPTSKRPKISLKNK